MKRLCLAVVVITPLALVAILCLRIAAGAVFGRSRDTSSLRRAIQADPMAAEYHRKLGALLSSSWNDARDRQAGLHEVEIATNLGAQDPQNWLALARVSQLNGDTARMEVSMRRAIALAPNNPKYYWEAANLFLSTDRPHLAVPMMRDFIALNPSGTVPAVKACASAMPLEVIWSELIREYGNPRQISEFAALAAQDGNSELALRAWRHGTLNSNVPDVGSARLLTETFLQQKLFPQAYEVWSRAHRTEVRNLLFNGDFSDEFSNAGFDWRHSSQDEVTTSREIGIDAGRNALRITFSANRNSDLEPIYQFVLAKPETEYLLRARVRSDAITSESGPRLRVMDAEDDTAIIAATAGLAGTAQWQESAISFTTGTNTRMLRISVWRPKARNYPGEISGDFWLANVKLSLSGKTKVQ